MKWYDRGLVITSLALSCITILNQKRTEYTIREWFGIDPISNGLITIKETLNEIKNKKES